MNTIGAIAAARLAFRKDYQAFAERVFEMVSGEAISSDDYVQVVCHYMAQVAARKINRLVLNMPPRHGKTILGAVSLAAWELGRHPARKVMILSHNEDLATEISAMIRDVLHTAWYKQCFEETRIKKGHDRRNDFATTKSGRLYASHMSGKITGKGAHLIIIDDPAPIDAAEDLALLDKINSTFDRVVANRLNTRTIGAIVIIGHRLHADDLCGHVLQQGDWTHVRLPLIAEQDESYETDGPVWARRAGDPLRAWEFSDTDLTRLRRQGDFASLYQQAPDGEATWTITADDFPCYQALPPDVGGVVISVDPAHAPGLRNSFSVAQVWQAQGKRWYLRDQLRAQLVPQELELQVSRLITYYRPSVVLIERTSAGIGLLAALNQRAARERFDLIPVIPGPQSHFARFRDVVSLIKARAIHLPVSAAWTTEFLEEILAFPRAPTDDQVDALSQYLAWANVNPPVATRQPRALGAIASRSGTRIFYAGQPQPPSLPPPRIFTRKRDRW